MTTTTTRQSAYDRQPTTGPQISQAPNPNDSYLTPMLVGNKDLPGPLSMNRLNEYGAIQQLDDINGYLANYSDTLFGRGLVMSNMVPRTAIACLTAATWVWLSGTFPDAITVVSPSHYRTLVYGRPITTAYRKMTPGHISQIAGLRLTSPTRTACDIALRPDDEIGARERGELVCSLIQEYHVDPVECLDIIARNRYWTNASQARIFFKSIEHCF